MSAVRTVSIVVRGKVQGVWFRASTKSAAQRLAVHGFVSNRPDGSVYIEASGSPSSIEEFISWCRRGPELARVDNVDIEDISRPAAFNTFEVRR
jgi:acylphosphatase